MRHGDEVRTRAAELFDLGWSHDAVARYLGLSSYLLRSWHYTYSALGKEALFVTTHKVYDFETKLAAVRDFLERGLSGAEVMSKYGIASINPLRTWIRLYREGGPDALSPKPKGRPRKPAEPIYASREEELEARVRELELELEIQKRIHALADEIERRSHRR